MNRIYINIGIYFLYIIVTVFLIKLFKGTKYDIMAALSWYASIVFLILHLLITLILGIINFRNRIVMQEYITSFLFLLLFGLPGCFFSFLVQH